MKTLSQYLSFTSHLVNRELNRLLPRETEKPRIIHKAMRYSVNAGGKRLRPILVIAAAEACGGKASMVLPTACAMELIHTYSLIHDDLPAMDDDDLRRGRPTNHKVFGEDIAILAGDALLTHAFALISQNALDKRIKSSAIIDVIKIIAQAAGSHGMIGGQVADIQADHGKWRNIKGYEFKYHQKLLNFIHLNKTSALIQASLLAGGHLVGGGQKQLKSLRDYGRNLGLAFQVKDDILDRIGDKKKLGKKGSDLANQKLTFPALYGLEASQQMATRYVSLAQQSLQVFGPRVPILHQLADYVLQRDR
jgi:geranylgeranyl diphosphate synthase type II